MRAIASSLQAAVSRLQRFAGFAGAVGFHLPGYMQADREILHDAYRANSVGAQGTACPTDTWRRQARFRQNRATVPRPVYRKKMLVPMVTPGLYS